MELWHQEVTITMLMPHEGYPYNYTAFIVFKQLHVKTWICVHFMYFQVRYMCVYKEGSQDLFQSNQNQPLYRTLCLFLWLMKGSDATSFKTHSGDLMTCYHLTNQKISCKFFGPIGMRMLWCVASTTIRYTHFRLLIFKLKRSLQKVTKTCFKLGCVRSFHEQQKQTGSKMKGLILIRLEFVFDVVVF